MRPSDHRRLVLERGPRDKVQRAVLLALWCYADSDTGVAWPSQAAIAKLTVYSVRAVRNAVQRLEAAGWIARGFKGGGGQDARLTVYRLATPAGPEASGTQSAASTSGTQSAASPGEALGLSPAREALDAAAGDSTSGTPEQDMRQLATGDAAPSVPTNSNRTPGGTPNTNSSALASEQTRGDRIKELTKLKIAAGIDSEKAILESLPSDLRHYEYARYLVGLVLREYKQRRSAYIVNGARV